jgi:hypothetical protein
MGVILTVGYFLFFPTMGNNKSAHRNSSLAVRLPAQVYRLDSFLSYTRHVVLKWRPGKPETSTRVIGPTTQAAILLLVVQKYLWWLSHSLPPLRIHVRNPKLSSAVGALAVYVLCQAFE